MDSTITAPNAVNHYILIDYENVQPKNLDILGSHPFTVIVFLGVTQTKVSRDFMKSILRLEKRAEIVEMSSSGKNALDFHIAFYLGELAAKDPKARFNVISKDKGFDALVRHMTQRKISVRRVGDLAEIPQLRIPKKTARDDMIELIVANLVGRGPSRPRKTKTLKNTIGHLVADKLSDADLDALIQEMQKRKLLVISSGNVRYTLPN